MKSRYTLSYRRKREGKTNYNARLKLLSSKKVRIVVRKSLRSIQMQIIEYCHNGDVVKVSAHSRELVKLGWKGGAGNTPSAYLTGLLLGKKALKAGIKDCIVDIGLQASVKGSVLYAAIKGVIDAGVTVPFSDGIAPDESRIRGEHIATWAATRKGDKKEFVQYTKNSLNPEELPSHFDQIKQTIAGGQ